MDKKRILIVEDEFIIATSIQAAVEELGFVSVGTTATGEGAIKMAEEQKPDLILMDINLKGEITGITAAGIIKEHCGIPVVYVTGQSDDGTLAKALESDPFGYILKPFRPKELKTSIAIALYKHEMDTIRRKNEQTISALLNATPDPLALIDSGRRIVATNEALCRLLGTTRENLERNSLPDMITGEPFFISDAMLDEIFSSGNHSFNEAVWDKIWYEIVLFPIQYSDGTIVHAVLQLHDITWRKKFEEQLRSEGIAQISHNMEQFQILNDQIRNPLQVLLLLLARGKYKSDPRILEQVKTIDALVGELDKGWVESAKVHSFLLRHYRPPAGDKTGSISLKREKS